MTYHALSLLLLPVFGIVAGLIVMKSTTTMTFAQIFRDTFHPGHK